MKKMLTMLLAIAMLLSMSLTSASAEELKEWRTYQITTSEISISLTVKLEDKVKALIALSEAFGL